MVGFMKSKIVEPNGYSLIEMMIVMMLLVLFGLGIFMLAATSSTTYQKLVEDKETAGELRIASSYLMTKIRQNDRMGAIRIEKSAINISSIHTLRWQLPAQQPRIVPGATGHLS